MNALLTLNRMRPALARSFCASSSSDAQVRITSLLEAALKPVNLEVLDTSGGCGAMYSIKVESTAFQVDDRRRPTLTLRDSSTRPTHVYTFHMTFVHSFTRSFVTPRTPRTGKDAGGSTQDGQGRYCGRDQEHTRPHGGHQGGQDGLGLGYRRCRRVQCTASSLSLLRPLFQVLHIIYVHP